MIYLNRRKVLVRVLLFILFVITIFCFSYISSYFKYNDSSFIESELLIKENLLLKKEINELSGFEMKNDSYVIGKVLNRDLYSFYEEIVINLGEEDVSVGDAVVNEKGLIGVVYKVGNYRSVVKLLTSNYNVSVVIGNTYGNLNNGTISMLNKYSDIKEGDLVYTSNYGDVEKDIYVGIVKKVSYDKDGLGKEVEVELVDNKNLNYIGVIKRIK